MTDFGLVCLTSDITGIAVGVSSKNSPELNFLTFLSTLFTDKVRSLSFILNERDLLNESDSEASCGCVFFSCY